MTTTPAVKRPMPPEVGEFLLGRVTIRTLVGAHRVVGMLAGEQLPRIC
ncbi:MULTISPECIES: hypothetical protein [unclassified Kitasatospora]